MERLGVTDLGIDCAGQKKNEEISVSFLTHPVCQQHRVYTATYLSFILEFYTYLLAASLDL